MMVVKKNDTVVIITGTDKNKRGKVISVWPKKGKVLVQGINIITRHAKARKSGEVSAIKKEEAAINISNVMPICSSCQKPSRLQVKAMEDNSRVRMCNHCKEIF